MMINDFITLSEAEKLTGKSRATLVRLSNKVNADGYSVKDDSGRWMLSEAYLVRYYDLSSISRDAKQGAKGMQSNDKELQSQISELIERIAELTKTNALLFRQNSELMNENRQLLSERTAPDQHQSRPFYLVVIVLVVVVVLLIWLVSKL